MSSTVNLKASGLVTQMNQLSAPEGALTEASNVVIQRDDIIEPRRGFGLFGNSFGSLSDTLKQLFLYKGRLLRYWGDTLEYDNGVENNAGLEEFLPFDGSFDEAQSGLRTKSIESNGNFYFTSSDGIQKISAASASQFTENPGFITPAGGIKALGMTAATVIEQGNITGFMPQDSTVAYRAVWGTNDNNKNLILGVPSPRVEVYNSLSDLLVVDFNNTLQQIQNTADQPSPNDSIIDDTDYVSALALANGADPTLIYDGLIALADKLDTNIALANDIGSLPLTISAFSIINSISLTNNVATISFSSGDPTVYWSAGSNIYLTGFPLGENKIDFNGVQTLSAVSSTTATFLTDATGNSQIFNSTNVDIVTETITINTHGFQNLDQIRLTNSGGALPTGLSAGTTYYVGAVTNNTFQLFTSAVLGVPINITAVGSGTNTIAYFSPIASTSINSGEFRSIAQPTAPSTPATNAQLVEQQTYLENIIQILQDFPATGTPPIISAYSQTHYITTLSVTTSANVDIRVSIPQGVTTNDFLQVYRTPILQATGSTALSDLTPSDELQQVYEVYPSSADISDGHITFTDITPDQFLGGYLYTNQASGVGIANANETPPWALDVNRFKNVTFYANTKTKYRMLLNLLGVSEMVDEYNSGTTPTLVISDGVTTNTYSFVLGVQQVTQAVTVADSANSLNGTYFLIYSAEDAKEYYIWYKTSGGVPKDPANYVITVSAANATEGAVYTNSGKSFTVANTISGATTLVASGTGNPAASGTLTKASGTGDATITYSAFVAPTLTAPTATGIEVFINTGETNAHVAAKTRDAINSLLVQDFAATTPGSSNTLIITNNNEGYTTSATAATSGFTVTTSTSGVGQKNSDLQVLLSNKTSPAQAVNETALSLIDVINSNTNETVSAFYLSQSSTVPGQMTLESRSLATPQYYLLANNTATGTSFNPDLSPSIAITSIAIGNPSANIVTTSSPHNLMTGDQVVFSNTDSTPSANGLWTITYLSANTFRINLTVTVAATKGEMRAATDTNAGDNDVKVNRICYSSYQQPESVPLGNTIDVGDADKPILRILPLRDTLFVFKEEALYRISGETAPFSLQLFDTSCLLIAPDSLSIAKNVIYGWTTQGILSITEAGVSNPPISRPIDNQILSLNNQNYSSFSTSTWGLGYDSDNSYIVYTVTDPADTKATIAYRYSTLTNTWTTFDKTNTCGLVNISNDKLYLGAGDINFIEQERKNYSRFDYADRELASVINDGLYFGNRIQLPATRQFSIGDVLVQDQNVTVYEFNSLLGKLDIDTLLQTNNISAVTTGLTPTITTTGSHYLSSGDYVTITGSTTTPLIDGVYQATVLNATQFTIALTSPIVTSATTGTVKYSYSNTLAVSGGADIKDAQTLLSARLNIEPGLIYKSNTSTITSNSVANPTVLMLSAPHTMGGTGTIRNVHISGVSGSTPSINGNYEVTVIDSTHVSLPVHVTVGGTGGTLQTIDDYVNSIAASTGSITNITVANPTIVTAPNHGMVSDKYIRITGSDSSPVIDGNYAATIINDNTFSIPYGVLVAGTTGSFASVDSSFENQLVNYNYIIDLLNADPGTVFNNYSPVTEPTSLESIIIGINQVTKQITTENALDYIVGPVSVFEAIDSTFTYSPVSFKDPLNLKQVSEATLMFENKAFSSAELSFKSDLIPEFIPIPFSGTGNGAFGGPKFGGGFFGGASNAAPFRTYIPRDAQRCRYIVPKFSHAVAFEKYIINGLTLTGNIGQSSRAYR